jgi:hypothetical protein
MLQLNSNNLALDTLLHWFQMISIIINNPLHTLQQAVFHLLHLFRVHIRSHHTLRVIIALHHGPRETILEISYFLLRDGRSSLIGYLALLGTLLDLFFATIFASSCKDRRETHPKISKAYVNSTMRAAEYSDIRSLTCRSTIQYRNA